MATARRETSEATFKLHRIKTNMRPSKLNPDKKAEGDRLKIPLVHQAIVEALGELGYVRQIYEPTLDERYEAEFQVWLVVAKSLDEAELIVRGTPLCREGLMEIAKAHII